MDFLNIKRAHIVGHSIGGTIALQLASSYPDYIKSLILLEPAITGYNEFTNRTSNTGISTNNSNV